MFASLLSSSGSAQLSHGRRLLLAVSFIASVVALADASGRMVVLLVLLLLAPGYLAERALTGARLPLLARMALWISFSLSATALLYQWTWALELTLATPLLWGGVVLLASAALPAAWHDLGSWPAGTRTDGMRWANLLSMVIVGLTLCARLSEIATLAFPPWVDSLHHALLVQIAAERGSAPLALAPYLPVEDLPYHWGYHVFIATLLRLSSLDLLETILLSGQLLNTLLALAVAGLAGYLWRRPLAAPVAALVVGLVSLMPAYYLSWGRYTQLTGLLMLPGLAVAWQVALGGRGRGWWWLAATMLAGLSLVHFRVLIFALALLGALTLVWMLGQPWRKVRPALLGALLAGLVAGALTTPWLLLLLRRALLPAVAPEGSGLAGGGSYNAFNSGLLWVGANYSLVALALSGALLGLHRRAQAATVVLLWVGLLLLVANPWLLGYLLPGLGFLFCMGGLNGLFSLMSEQQRSGSHSHAEATLRPARRMRSYGLLALGAALLLLNPALVQLPYLWLITNDTVVISLFTPLALLIGGGAALLYEQLWRRGGLWLRRALPVVGLALLAATGFWGWRAISAAVLNPSTVLATPADRAAIAWAAAQTPREARFLVNAAPWLATARRGADGGWWLLPLAGRWTTAPPVLFTYGEPDYVRHVNALNDVIIGYVAGGEQAILDLISAERITHIYLVEGRGPLERGIFEGRSGFSIVYEQDGVVIIAVDS